MLELDHVVYFTEQAPVDVVEGQKELGWHAVVGGSHEKWGTQNALMYMSNAYIEWFSVEYEEIAVKSNHQLVELLLHDISDGEDWGTVCFSVKEIEAFNEKIKNAGFKTSGVLNAARKTVTGNIVKWKMLFVEQQSSDKLPLPFFIEWEVATEERFNLLRENGTILPDNEKLKITECVFRVSDPNKEAAVWSALLSVKTFEESCIHLSNVILKFKEKAPELVKERLVDVVIEHV